MPRTRSSTVSFRHAEDQGQDRKSLDVHEFLALAAASKWVVISDDPKSKTVFMCCPSLQPTMLQEGEHVRLIQASGSVKLMVDDMSNIKYESFKDELIAEENAYVSMLSLLKQKGKSRRKKGEGQRKEEKMGDVVPMEVLQPKEDPQEIAEEGLKETACIEKEDADVAENVNAEIAAVASAKEGTKKIADAIKEGARAVDDVFFDDRKIIVQGKAMSSLELLADIWVQQKQMNIAVGKIEKMERDLKALHKSLSQVAERGCRSNLALLYADVVGKHVELIQPIVSRWFPYNEEQMGTQNLEKWASLHKREEENVQKSGLIEVDMLLKVMAEGVECRKSPQYVESSRFSEEASGREFTHIIIGEYSRSTELCARATDYCHPKEPCRNGSSKLLYKLIQVERAATAATHYYQAEHCFVDAAAIMSPSFKRLADPKLLIQTVLSHLNGELPIVEGLFYQGRMWLVDL